MKIIIYAFTMKQHRSIYGAKVDTPQQIAQRVIKAIEKGAEVISIRIYR